VPPQHDTILVVDFGAQYAQLIARRVREARVYSEIVPRTMPLAEMLAKQPLGIIFSGGPASVHVEGAPSIDPRSTTPVPIRYLARLLRELGRWRTGG
jgi:GMP synthase-like glutamine amidotransferase